MENYSWDIRRKNIKHLYIRIDREERTIRISCPKDLKESSLEAILKEKRPWISARIEEEEQRIYLGNYPSSQGQDLYIFGQKIYLRINYISSGKYRLERSGNYLDVFVYKRTKERAIEDLVRSYLRQLLAHKIEAYLKLWQPRLGLEIEEYFIKDMKTRWGSCNIGRKRIWINLRLVFIDEAFLEYVLVHELIHLIERGHGRAFKKIMAENLEDWAQLDRQLRKYSL